MPIVFADSHTFGIVDRISLVLAPDVLSLTHGNTFACNIAPLRTGMLSMLLQSTLGLSDDEIVLDYFKSNQIQNGSAALRGIRKKGVMDHDTFSGTNPEAMETTLRFLRSKYGSVSPGYLNDIGFDEIWRRRLLAVIKRTFSRL